MGIGLAKMGKRVLLIDADAQGSLTASLLYGLMLDRMSLSMKNGWFDEENRAYIIYTVENMMEDLGCSKPTYICPYKTANIAEIIAKVESHLPQNVQINRSTYFRWRDQALRTVDSILWGYEEESRKLLEHYRDTWQETE